MIGLVIIHEKKYDCTFETSAEITDSVDKRCG